MLPGNVGRVYTRAILSPLPATETTRTLTGRWRCPRCGWGRGGCQRPGVWKELLWMAAVVEWTCHSEGWGPSQELAPVLTEKPSHFSGCLATLHPDPGNSRGHGNQEASWWSLLSIGRLLRHCLAMRYAWIDNCPINCRWRNCRGDKLCVAGKYSERLVIRIYNKGTALDHMSEVLDRLTHCQELVVVRTVLLLSGAELMWAESHGLSSVADTLLQGGADSYTGSVCKYGQHSRWVQVSPKYGTGEASPAVLESLDHGGCPVHQLWSFDLGTS